MSFIGVTGTLVAETELLDILSAAFGSVPKMLEGKMFPQNIRALRMLAKEVLAPILRSSDSPDEFQEALHNTASRSKTAKTWIDNFILPVLFNMIYVRPERERVGAPPGCCQRHDFTILFCRPCALWFAPSLSRESTSCSIVKVYGMGYGAICIYKPHSRDIEREVGA